MNRRGTGRRRRPVVRVSGARLLHMGRVQAAAHLRAMGGRHPWRRGCFVLWGPEEPDEYRANFGEKDQKAKCVRGRPSSVVLWSCAPTAVTGLFLSTGSLHRVSARPGIASLDVFSFSEVCVKKLDEGAPVAVE